MKKYNFDFNYFAEKLDELIKVISSKSISYSNDTFINEIKTILETAFDFSEDTPIGAYPVIISDGIHLFVRKRKKDGQALKSSIRQSESKYLKGIKRKFILLTSLSFRYFDKLPRLNIDGVSVQFLETVPKKYKIFDNDSIKYKFPQYPPSDYVIVKLTLQARTVYEAVDIGLEKLNFIRGLWNYSINRRLRVRVQSGVTNPINEIRLGPLHTIHNVKGDLVDDLFWYEREFINKSTGNLTSKKWDYILKDFKHFRSCIKKSKSTFDIKAVLNFYTNTLDTNDYESVFIKLWTLLEQLTDTGNMSYDKTIKRTFSFYRNDKFIKETLEHLRIIRNNVIHKGESRNKIDPDLYQLKRFVERLFLFHINNLNYFHNLQEVGQFLDINREKKSIQKEIQYRKRLFDELY